MEYKIGQSLYYAMVTDGKIVTLLFKVTREDHNRYYLLQDGERLVENVRKDYIRHDYPGVNDLELWLGTTPKEALELRLQEKKDFVAINKPLVERVEADIEVIEKAIS